MNKQKTIEIIYEALVYESRYGRVRPEKKVVAEALYDRIAR